MGKAEQQEQLDRIVRRFADVAPARWARLVGNWEAYPGPTGEVTLNYLTLAVVDGGARGSVTLAPAQPGREQPGDEVAAAHRHGAGVDGALVVRGRQVVVVTVEAA